MKSTPSKSALREQIRARLHAMAPEHRAGESARIRSLLETQPAWKNAAVILFYAPLPEEPDVWPLLSDSLAAGRLVALPRFDAQTKRYVAGQIEDPAHDIQSGRLGIREATEGGAVLPWIRLDFVLVPGVAFDLHGRRLGRGKGYYDQMLESVRGIKCGVAFDEQIVPEIPVEPHDVRLDCILTPTRWIEP